MTTITPVPHSHWSETQRADDEEIVTSDIEIWRPLLVTLLFVRDAVTSEADKVEATINVNRYKQLLTATFHDVNIYFTEHKKNSIMNDMKFAK